MRKFINFCKKPLLIIASVFFVCFMVTLIVLCCVPHTKNYTDQSPNGGYSISFKKDNVLEVGDGETLFQYNYKIEDKILYCQNPTSEKYEAIGTINAFEIRMNDYQNPLYSTINPLKFISIVGMCLNLVLVAGSCVIMVLDKKGLLIKTKPTEETK